MKTMTENKDYIESPAGMNDNFTIVGVEMQEYFDKQSKEGKATKNNTEMKTPNQIKREVLSTELEAGMAIPAEKGGIKQTKRDGESR